MDYVCLDTTIKELSKIENLSNRAINICKYNNLNNLFLILDYYNSHGHFHDIRNCGLQTNNELVQISKKYRSLHHSNKVLNIVPPESELIPPKIELPIDERYTQFQKEIFTNFINVKIRSVSVRLKNILRKYLNNDYSFDTFERLILLTPEVKLKNINGIGYISFFELKNLIDDVNEYIHTTLYFKKDESLLNLYSTYLQRSFRVEYEDVLLITSGYDFTRGIPIFKTVFYLSKLKKIIDSTERSLFFSDSSRYIDFSTENLFSDISECTASRQKIRIINKNLPSKLFQNITIIFNDDLKNYCLNTYSFDRQADYILVDDKQLEEICSTENVSFTKEFVAFILSAVFKDTLFLFGDEERLYPHRQMCGHFELRNFYLINRRFENIFNFRKFLILFRRLHYDKRELLNNTKDFRLFLKQFFLLDDYSEIDTIAEICELIIHVEFPYWANYANFNISSPR